MISNSFQVFHYKKVLNFKWSIVDWGLFQIKCIFFFQKVYQANLKLIYISIGRISDRDKKLILFPL